MKKSAAVLVGAILAVGGAAPAFADSGAEGVAANSPGVISGNAIEVPVHVPVNACGDSVDVIGALNPALGARCDND
ncbi:chaplin [Streptomyces sp. NPDC003388]|uniref:chaplin n=1 Tax=unclassified Streptomyces TaxID=2593676 RepID=UPI002482B9E8|nr:chaplin [Streptomyces sp. ATE26]MDI1453433.1 chaplin [Streptomyces sp. ATE26]